MKNVVLFILVLLSITATAQDNVTKFLGIPVDGTKADMIQKLKSKGFLYNSTTDYLTGEFNGREVEISVVTNNNKVYRIMLRDATTSDETSIKIRFNTLCQQFLNNKKYMSTSSSEDYMLSDDEQISYEMSVHNKRYEASFFQADIDTLALQQEALAYALSKYSSEELEQMSQEQQQAVIKDFSMQYFLEKVTKKFVWFMIDEEYGKFRILMYYDNEYNHANGEDL